MLIYACVKQWMVLFCDTCSQQPKHIHSMTGGEGGGEECRCIYMCKPVQGLGVTL